MSAKKDLQKEIEFLTGTVAAESEEKISISSELTEEDLNSKETIEPKKHSVIKKISYAQKHNFEIDENMKEEITEEETYLDSVMENKYVKSAVEKTKAKANDKLFKKHEGKINPVLGFIVKLCLLPYIYFRDYTKAFVSMPDKIKKRKTKKNFSIITYVAIVQIVGILALEYWDENPMYLAFLPVVILLLYIYATSRK